MVQAVAITDIHDRVEISVLGAGGDGIAQGVAVRGALPGEVIEAGALLSRSEHRTTPPCRHFGKCGGCVTQHADDAFLAQWKTGVVAQALRAQQLPDTVRKIYTSPAGTRRRVTLSGRRTKKTVQIGFYARGTHELFPIEECHILVPEIVAAFDDLRAIVRLAASRKSVVRLSVTLVNNGLDLAVDQAVPLDQSVLQELAGFGECFVRIFWNGELALQAEAPIYQMGKAQVPIPSGTFLQATQDGEAALVASVTEAVGDAKSVVDLFSGCGTFSLPLAARADIHAVEADKDMLRALAAGWRGATGLKGVSTEARNLAGRPLRADELNAYQAIVLDPPRAGAAAQTEQIGQSQVSKVVYVSCNPVSAARDMRVLADAGFALEWVDVVDQFRWSTHIEMVACLTRE